MKVAIIGAGLSGLSCAFELQKFGITPTIFEKKDYVGEILELPAIMMKIFNSPEKEPLKYLKNTHDLIIKPNYKFKEAVMVSHNLERVVRGDLGYIFRRDKSEKALINQIYKHVNTKLITFNHQAELNQIRMDYDFVVVSTGTVDIPKQMNLFQSHFRAFARIATVEGDFNVNSVKVWFNKEYAKTGYAYLVANTPKEAFLILIVSNIEKDELNKYWNKFLEKEKIPYKIIKTTTLKHEVGLTNPVQKGNVYFTGIAGGFIDSILGFGAIPAIISGVLAGNSIANNLDYRKLVKPFVKDIKEKLIFRTFFDTFNNNDYDKLVNIVTMPVIKQCIYNNPAFYITQGTFLLKLFNKIKN